MKDQHKALYKAVYRKEQRLIQDWIDQCCRVGDARESPTRLHESFRQWIAVNHPCEQKKGHEGGTMKMFVRLLLSLGYSKHRLKDGRMILGLAVTTTPCGVPANPTTGGIQII